MSIICAKCGTAHVSNVVYDRTPCSICGNPMTAYITTPTGERLSEEAALAKDIPLNSTIPNETQAEFRARVEAAYSRPFQPGETWVLFRECLIVAHPDRAPIIVHKGGRTEEMKIDVEPLSALDKKAPPTGDPA